MKTRQISAGHSEIPSMASLLSSFEIERNQGNLIEDDYILFKILRPVHILGKNNPCDVPKQKFKKKQPVQSPERPCPLTAEKLIHCWLVDRKFMEAILS